MARRTLDENERARLKAKREEEEARQVAFNLAKQLAEPIEHERLLITDLISFGPFSYGCGGGRRIFETGRGLS